MTRQLDVHNLSAVSPNIFASPHPQMSSGLGPLDKSARPPRLVVRRHPKGYIGVSFIEIQLITFRMTANGWPCYYSLLDPVTNAKSWGYDVCYSKFCSASLGLVDAVAIHYGRPSIYGNIGGIYNHDGAEREMYDWVLKYKKRHSKLSGWPDDPAEIIRLCVEH